MSYIDYEVERECGVSTSEDGKTLFKIIWKDESEWLSEEYLNCEELIQEFWQANDGEKKYLKKNTWYICILLTYHRSIPKKLLLLAEHEHSFKQDL